MLKAGQIIEFNRSKYFKYLKELGDGGTGDAFLFEDETTNIKFAIKKYMPKGQNDMEECYDRFVDEIKILFNLAHPSIVRIYNYYLYPESKSGYLQMEYIKGVTIDSFKCTLEKNWNDLFVEAVNAFVYLEKNHIVHRDIKASNIMVDENNNLKVIDFGFGKKSQPDEMDEPNSVRLNWPVNTFPSEVFQHTYNHQTDMFFLGKLFEKLIFNQNIEPFKYYQILDKMTKTEPGERYLTFEAVSRDISKGIFSEIEFTDIEKQTYIILADFITENLIEFTSDYTPIHDSEVIINNLEDIIRMSALEEYIVNTGKLIKCFVNGGFRYENNFIQKKVLIEFYQFFKNLTDIRKRIVLDNLANRFDIVKVNIEEEDFIPF